MEQKTDILRSAVNKKIKIQKKIESLRKAKHKKTAHSFGSPANNTKKKILWIEHFLHNPTTLD